MLPGKVSCLSLPKCYLGEGPHWDHITDTLLYVDINKASIQRWNPYSDYLQTFTVKEVPTIGAVVPRQKGGLVIAAGQQFAFFDENSGAIKTIHKINTKLEGTRFNDGKCDPMGRFWAGTMGQEEKPAQPVFKQGALFCLNNDLKVSTKIADGIDISNGISWTSDHKTMYYTDSLKFCIDAYDFDLETGSISNPRQVVKFSKDVEGIPDGHCIDVDGNLWVALYFGSGLVKIDPITGTKIGYIKISDTAHQTTSVCFGGKNMDEMYVTSAISKNPKSDQDEGGKLFKVTHTGSKGPKPFIFQG